MVPLIQSWAKLFATLHTFVTHTWMTNVCKVAKCSTLYKRHHLSSNGNTNDNARPDQGKHLFSVAIRFYHIISQGWLPTPMWMIFKDIFQTNTYLDHFGSFLGIFGPFCGIFGQICGKIKFFCGIDRVTRLAFRMYGSDQNELYHPSL